MTTSGAGRGRAFAAATGATLASAAIAALLFAAVLHGEWMTPLFARAAALVFARPAWAALAAGSPIAAGLLIGYAHMRRELRRRARQA